MRGDLVLAWAKVLEAEGYFAPVMLLVPLWGPLCVLLLHTSNRLTGGCLREQTLEKLHINEEIHKSILVADDEGEDWSFHWRKRCWLTVPRRNASSSSRC